MMLEVDRDELPISEMVVVVPLLTVTEEVPLFKMGPCDPVEEELPPLAVLVGVVNE